MSINVFVYGTLRSGEIHDLTQVAARHGLPAPRFTGPGRVPGHLVDFGDWPGLLPAHDGRCVIGDIYQVDPRLLPVLDDIEEVHPEGDSCFVRAEVQAETALGPVLCQYYPVNPGAAPSGRHIAADDWVSYRAARDTAALGSLETPALLLDLDRLRANTDMMRARATALGVMLRPHVKTAKCIEVALAAGGGQPGPITVSTLKEAERFHAAGFDDILYAVGITPNKLEHVGRLRRAGCNLKIILDNRQAAEAVCAARARLALDLPCLLEIDCDGHRSGLKPDDPELPAIADLLRAGGVTVAGVLTHAGESYNCRSREAIVTLAEQERAACVAAAQRLRDQGHPCPIVSVGSTPTARYARHLEGVTELRAGVYVFFDLVMAGVGACTPDEIALSVLVTVLGHQADRGWIITDGGWMALSRDRGTARQPVDQGYGLVCDRLGRPIPGLRMTDANQEHGVLAFDSAPPIDLAAAYPVGSQLRILPNHACATAAQHTRYHLVRPDSDRVEGIWARFGGW